jgi:hypothetical protein
MSRRVQRAVGAEQNLLFLQGEIDIRLSLECPPEPSNVCQLLVADDVSKMAVEPVNWAHVMGE